MNIVCGICSVAGQMGLMIHLEAYEDHGADSQILA
jgi:hypothetical protein